VEATHKLETLRSRGPTREAFTFRATFPPPDAPAGEESRTFADECPAT